jgi:NADPH-dependent curcumin reductase CurA
MTEAVNREIRLKQRPVGMPQESDFELVETPVPEPAEGELLIRNVYMSVDPYMRGRMMDRKSYVPPYKVGETMSGGCVGRVMASKVDRFQVDEYVLSNHGWREYYVTDGGDLTKVDPQLAPLQTYLGTLGMPGVTAYVGFLDIGQPQSGETVFVSAASGAVGSIVCQIAKIKGCRVVGSAGSSEKVSWLLDVAGVDAAFNYKEVQNLSHELGKHCPKGIDIYFENVGGEHLEAAIEHMNQFGRIAACGNISLYNRTEPQPAPRNMHLFVSKRLMLKGFLVFDHFDQLPRFMTEMSQWIAEDRIRWHETIIEGIENAPTAFIGLFKGANLGKMIVKIGPDLED